MNEQRKFEYLHVVGQQSIVVIVIVAVRKPKICHRKFVVHTYTRALAKENLPQKTYARLKTCHCSSLISLNPLILLVLLSLGYKTRNTLRA